MANAYQKRVERKKALQHERASLEREERWLETIKHCNRYEQAYLALYGRLINVTYVKGWYLVHNRRYREAELIDLAGFLEAKKHVEDYPAPEEA